MDALKRHDYSGEDGVDGGGGNVLQEVYRIGELADFGDGLQAKVIGDAEARAIVEQTARSSEGRPVGLFDTAAHRDAWTIAWRYFCDNYGEGRDGKWFSRDFRPTMYWGRLDEDGRLRSVAFTFAVAPATEGVSGVTVCGDANDLRVALARADHRHYNEPATPKPLFIYAE